MFSSACPFSFWPLLFFAFLRHTDSDYPFGIFKLFLTNNLSLKVLVLIYYLFSFVVVFVYRSDCVTVIMLALNMIDHMYMSQWDQTKTKIDIWSFSSINIKE